MLPPRATVPATPPLPQTPERGRARTRYPSHLQLDAEGKPRPLLHRRGTSHMYETLEDLLKEAGYKETRIFTPEVDRRDPQPDARSKSGVGGAVVKMLSTWMSKKSVVDLDDADEQRAPSPLAHLTRPRVQQPPQSPTTSSVLTVRPTNQLTSAAALQDQHLLTRPPLRPPPTPLGVSNPNSRARLALRHAASAPHMDKRRTRTQPRPSRPTKSPAPPLPSTWLESLSAALLSPRLSPPSSPTASASAKSAPVSASKSVRKPTVLSHRPPPTSVAVTITNVVCRSAPSSRSSSAVRPPNSKSKLKPKPNTRITVPVPTLAQTCVCEEQQGVWPPHSPHHLPRSSGEGDDAFVDDDDDDDHELNLTMMLIPSKRQHSIRSLRSVLQQHGSAPRASSSWAASVSASSASGGGQARPRAVVGASGHARAYVSTHARPRDDFARVMRRRIDESEYEDDDGVAGVGRGGRGRGRTGDESGHWDSGEYMSARVKRRRSNLPRQWSWAS